MWLFPFGMPWIPFLALGLTVASIYWFQFRQRQARTDALAMIASGIGFDFSVIDTYGFETMPFALFRQGKGRKAQNVMTGTHNGLPLSMFDYEYYIQGRNREYHRFTCAVMTIPAACPALRIAHENVATWLGRPPRVPRRRARVRRLQPPLPRQCDDQKFAFTMLDGQMMDWLLGADGFDRVEVIGPWVLIARRPQVDPRRGRPRDLARRVPHAHSARRVFDLSAPVITYAGPACNSSSLIALIVIAVVRSSRSAIYNRLVRLRNMIRESWRNIDTELQRRYDLIPNLVSTVKGYAAHERAVFESVTQLRTEAMAEHGRADAQAPREQALGQGVAQLIAVAEGYPDLKASEQFLALQRELVDTEDRIQVARRIYNANVRAYDSLVQTFPSLLIARRVRLRAPAVLPGGTGRPRRGPAVRRPVGSRGLTRS